MKRITPMAVLVMGMASSIAGARGVTPDTADTPAEVTSAAQLLANPAALKQAVTVKYNGNHLVVSSNDAVTRGARSTGGYHFDAARVQVIPAMMPPSLTKLSFDRVECATPDPRPDELGAHFDIVWEPLERAPLARDAFLTIGCWQVSLHAVPIPHATQPYVDTSWSRFAVATTGNSQGSTLCAFRQVGDTASPAEPWTTPVSSACPAQPGWTGVPISIRPVVLAKPGDLLSRFGNKGEEYTPLPSANRAFGVNAEGLVDDAFQAVADLAVEEAEAKVLQAANELLLERLCGEDSARWLSEQLRLEKVSLDDLKGEMLFGNTCAALQNVRLRDLTSASKNLQQALLKDGLSVALLAARQTHTSCSNPMTDAPGCFAASIRDAYESEMLATSFVSLGTLLGSVVLERRGASLSDAQLIVRQAVGAVEESLRRRAPVGGVALPLNSREVDLVIAATTLAFCHANGRCDTHLIREVLESPEKFFDVSFGGTFPRRDADLTSFRRNEAQLVNIVTEGLEVMSPKTRADASEAIRHATSFLRYLTDYWLQNECQENQREVCKYNRQKFAQLFDLTDAIADRDVPMAITATAAVLGNALVPQGKTGTPTEEQQLRIQRVMRYASAMASYAGTYSMAPSSEDPSRSREEQRLARKQALRSLVDLGSDRSMRKHELLVSLSVTPGLRPSAAYIDGKAKFAFQPSLPLGIALTYQGAGSVGFYAQGYGADLGQYAVVVDTPGKGSNTPKATPYSALTVGGTLGMSYRDFIIGIDGRWTPNLEGGGDDTWHSPRSLGIQLGYHLPLITF